MGFRKDQWDTVDLIADIRAKEQDVPVTYDKDEINQAIKHTREDVVGLSNTQTQALKQLHQIKTLLIVIIVLGIIAMVLFGN